MEKIQKCQCHKGYKLIEGYEIEGKIYCPLAALYLPNTGEICDKQECKDDNIGGMKCKDCGKEWSDGLDEMLAGIGITGLKSDTNLCPDCLGKRRAEGKPIFD